MNKIFFLLSLSCVFLSSKAVEVDEILTQKDNLKMDLMLSYSNIKRERGVFLPLQYQTENGDFVTVPTFMGEQQANQDYINYALNLKYGVNSDLEIFTLLNLYSSDIHFSQGSQFETKSDRGFGSWVLGANYQIKAEDERPSLLVGAMINMVERVTFSNQEHKNIEFKSYRLSATTYYTVDPLVYLLNISYNYNEKKEYNDLSIDKGEQLLLSPQLYFAVNPYSSIHLGIKYAFIGKSRVDDKVVSNSGSNISYSFGSSYEISSNTIMNITAEHSKQLNISRDSLSLGFSYSF